MKKGETGRSRGKREKIEGWEAKNLIMREFWVGGETMGYGEKKREESIYAEAAAAALALAAAAIKLRAEPALKNSI